MSIHLFYIITAISYVLMLLVYHLVSRRIAYNRTLQGQVGGNEVALNARHLFGLLIMLPVIIICFYQKPESVKFVGIFNNTGFYSWFLLIAFATLAFSIKAGSNTQAIPGLSSISTIPGYLLLRILFLVVYEFYFRIALLHILPQQYVVLSITINVILYGVAHISEPRKIFLLSFPFGVMLCAITLISQSVWPAIMIHLLLSIPYEYKVLVKQKSLTI
ncbi:MAG TPA: CPBP family intramembrane glutamic endopeptidase [Chitinophagaceae bacterium]